MSDVVERTLSALPGLLGQHDPGAGPGGAGGPGRVSASSRLGSLIRSITALTSKHEEEKLIQQELTSLKATVSAPTTTLRLMKECMVRLIYCEMLGYESSFGYIHAIKLAQQGNLLEKRVGYLAVSLFLHENHELLLLLVNTVVKDLQSTNLVEVCMALTVVSQIFPREMIPAVLPLIEDKLQHSKEIIRRKAVQALYKFYLIAPNQVQHIHDKFRKALCDRDAGVMAASLHIYLQMIKENSSGYKDLTGSFVTILKQVVGGKLSADFNYHSVPAPWLQIQLLRIFGLLGKDDPRTSELMYGVLDESLRRAEINHNITYAILFECVQTIYTIYPKSELLEKAAKCIGKFVLSPKINLKYLGLKALTYVIQQDPNLALQHQMTIIECLDHPDPIIKRETLELLYRITNGQNVIVIVQKMLDYLKESKDEYAIINLVGKIAELAEKYAPNNEWFIQTMNAVFSVGGDVVHSDIPNNFLRLLAEGFDDGEEDLQLRMYAVQSYLALLEEEDKLYPQKFLQVMSWVLGEYFSLVTDVDPEVILTKLHSLLKKTFVTSETKAWIMAAVTKIASHTSCSKTVDELIQELSSSLDTCLRQYAFELKHLCEDKALMKSLLPFDASCTDLVVDASLSFLDGFVAEGLGHGAAPYKPHHQRQEEKLSQEKALNFEPYGLSFASSVSSSGVTGRQSPTGLSFGSDTSGNSAETGHKETNTLKLEGVRKLWGKEGYLPKKENKAGKGNEPQAVPCGSLLAGQVGEPPALQPDQGASLSEEDKEKQQLASTLFVGLGSSAGVSLMGKADTATQKFKRKSKINETQQLSEEASDLQNSAASDFGPLLDTVPINMEDSEGSTHTRLRKASPCSSDNVEDNLAFETPQSLRKSMLDDRLSANRLSQSSLFADSNIEIFQPSPSASETPLVPSLPEELEELPHSEVVGLCQSDALALHLCKVWTHDSLLLIVFVSNKTTSALCAVNLVFEETEHFQILESATSQFPVIEAQSVEHCQKGMRMNKVCTQANLSGSVGYQSEMETRLEFSVTLSLMDFIRPMEMTTEDFGKLWLSLSNDVKQNIKMSSCQDSFSAALDTLEQKLKLHRVDIIGNEGILACQLLPSVPCLLHCRTHSGMLALWFRSPCAALPDGLLYQCQKVMEES
ncbi:AP-4 complex subunit epsilon-1 isoform X1 [Oenanthe melanoleuca]|uniref:AP-4 complex subunit epsilon-1 isoform X1 n=3 Tax=Oenanthe melanoleuca TaxID=2939378 RepID=UPI0024C18E97|nr:AP-4 complex subunit epsilon-1 isoform X1 [Oenanthe melanoleuca]XP_056355939.1 AP-4 complex subunit epsilon-1 isoform X1 [Oenanthe melanoleuca]